MSIFLRMANPRINHYRQVFKENIPEKKRYEELLKNIRLINDKLLSKLGPYKELQSIPSDKRRDFLEFLDELTTEIDAFANLLIMAYYNDYLTICWDALVNNPKTAHEAYGYPINRFKDCKTIKEKIDLFEPLYQELVIRGGVDLITTAQENKIYMVGGFLKNIIGFFTAFFMSIGLFNEWKKFIRFRDGKLTI